MSASPARPFLTVDIVIVASVAPVHVLLIQRRHDPFEGAWALPGGYVEQDEQIGDAARRELSEETGLQVDALRRIGIYDTPDRDPRGWTVTIAFLGVLDSKAPVAGGDDARDAGWFDVTALPSLAFDHAVILEDALKLQTDPARAEQI